MVLDWNPAALLPWLQSLCELGEGCDDARQQAALFALMMGMGAVLLGAFLPALGPTPVRPLWQRVLALCALTLMQVGFYWLIFGQPVDMESPSRYERRLMVRSETVLGFLLYSSFILMLFGATLGIILQCWWRLLRPASEK